MTFRNAAATANQNDQSDASRKISLVAGIFFLLTFVHIGILFLYDDILNHANFILGDGDDTPVRIGAVLDLATGLFGIATGVILFQVLRRQNFALGLGYVAVRTFEAIMIAIGMLCLLAVVSLRDAGATGADAANLTSIASGLIAVRDWTFVFGPGLCAGLGNGLLLGFQMLRSGLVPRNMALLGVIGGPLSLVGLTFVLFGAWEQDAPQQFLFTLGEIAWELSLSIYLIVKGFKASPLMAEISREAGRETVPLTQTASSAAI
jgi:hypothetical protein